MALTETFNDLHNKSAYRVLKHALSNLQFGIVIKE